MLSGIVNLVNTEVEEIMRPRIDIMALDMSVDYDEVKREIIESGYSRIPVYDEDLDDIKGRNCCARYISCPSTRRSTICCVIFRRTRYT